MKECGFLTQYGRKHIRAFANIYIVRILQLAMKEEFVVACSGSTQASGERFLERDENIIEREKWEN